jgi:hypothetical protein
LFYQAVVSAISARVTPLGAHHHGNHLLGRRLHCGGGKARFALQIRAKGRLAVGELLYRLPVHHTFAVITFISRVRRNSKLNL